MSTQLFKLLALTEDFQSQTQGQFSIPHIKSYIFIIAYSVVAFRVVREI